MRLDKCALFGCQYLTHHCWSRTSGSQVLASNWPQEFIDLIIVYFSQVTLQQYRTFKNLLFSLLLSYPYFYFLILSYFLFLFLFSCSYFYFLILFLIFIYCFCLFFLILILLFFLFLFSYPYFLIFFSYSYSYFLLTDFFFNLFLRNRLVYRIFSNQISKKCCFHLLGNAIIKWWALVFSLHQQIIFN